MAFVTKLLSHFPKFKPLTFNFIENPIDMRQFVLLCSLLLTLSALHAQVVYEDFEGGVADISWAGLNGTYDGVIPNPGADAVNSSEFVGSYTNSPDFDFCFALGTLAQPVDLSKFNLIKMKVWSPIADIQVLFKFEGGGNAVEMFRDIKVANEWVEYSFDLSAGADFETMDKVLVSFNPFVLGSTETFYFDDIVGVEALEFYEDFEMGARLPWNALDGEFAGPVENPDSNSVNGSDSVGMYVKSGLHAYSLLLADRGEAFDMSILNQFHLNVWAQEPTQVLLKLEGDGGPAIERTKNIGLKEEWQDYVFDFSEAAEWTHLSRVVLFFDPGVEMSADTYYLDNLRATSQGVCKNVELDPTLIDDFECNRNATYVNGWDSLTVVDNPMPDAVNTSSKVGRYGDPLGEPWATLLIDYQNPMDLSVNNQLKTKIWAPRAVQILFKLEGGASPAKEIWVDVETAGQWVDYEVDFSGEALNSHRKIAIFFNGGQDAEEGDAYFIDDIYWGKQGTFVIEDFEAGAFLPWAPLDDQELLHGTFAVIENPDPSGSNLSKMVGEYTKGTSAFSTLAAVAPGIIDITERPQYNLDVWAPEGGSVIMQLESVSQGNKEVERTLSAGAAWETLSFDFTEHQAIDDWASLRLIFNPGTAEEGTVYYFDNLTQSEQTVDPCEGTVPVTNVLDDFECQRNYDYGAGASLITAVNNPMVTQANSSTQVGLYMDQPNMPWDALCLQAEQPFDLSAFNQVSLQVLADEAVPVLLKLEDGVGAPTEVWTATTAPGDWETITGDFSVTVGMDYKRVCIFFNGGVKTAEVDNYYVDNIQFAHAPFTGCIMNFEEPAFVSDEWLYFPNGDSGDFELVDNPDQSGINMSSKVGKAVEKASGAQPWQGMYADLPAPIHFGTDKIVKMKVWSPQVTTVTMKLERPLTPGAPASSGDNTVTLTTSNEWEEVEFDFNASPTPLPDDGNYARVTLIWDIGNIPAEDVEYFFDDVQLSPGGCGEGVGLFDPPVYDALTINPNPVVDQLRIDELGRVSRLDVFNMYGQRIASVWTGSASSAVLDVSAFYNGAYIINGYSAKGELLAVSRFIKL